VNKGQIGRVERVSVRVTVPAGWHKRLKRAALDRDTTVAALVREAVDRLLDEQERAEAPGRR
jgi:hypothetical protein